VCVLLLLLLYLFHAFAVEGEERRGEGLRLLPSLLQLRTMLPMLVLLSLRCYLTVPSSWSWLRLLASASPPGDPRRRRALLDLPLMF